MFELNRLSLNDENEVKGVEYCGHFVNEKKAFDFATDYIKNFPELRTFIEISGPNGVVGRIRGVKLKNELT